MPRSNILGETEAEKWLCVERDTHHNRAHQFLGLPSSTTPQAPSSSPSPQIGQCPSLSPHFTSEVPALCHAEAEPSQNWLPHLTSEPRQYVRCCWYSSSAKAKTPAKRHLPSVFSGRQSDLQDPWRYGQRSHGGVAVSR